jgi:hypothetical protein
VRRRTLLIGGVVLAIVAGVAALNRVVDPKDEFYSGDALTAALASRCLLADDVVHARSYAELKHDLFTRSRATRVVLASDTVARPGLDLGYPGFGTEDLRDTMQFLSRASDAKLRVVVATAPAWFDPQRPASSSHDSGLAKLGYLVSPWTLASTLDLMRRSRTLAFSGWKKEPLEGSCVIDRGSPLPAFRRDGTFTGREPQHMASDTFVFDRLTAVDDALTLAAGRGWRVVGVSALPGSAVYRTELKALFAKHGYRWRVRKLTA